MLDVKQTERMLNKLRRFENVVEPMIFEKVGEAASVSAFATTDQFHSIPDRSLFDPIDKG